jgi:hypothetical protein
MDISRYPKRVEALKSRYVTQKELDDYLDAFPEKLPPAEPGFAKGGEVDSAAFGLYPQLKAKRSKQDPEASKEIPLNVLKALAPQDAVDLGLMVMGGPGGKLARRAGSALIAAGAAPEAEAGAGGSALKLADWLNKTFYRGIPRVNPERSEKVIDSVSGLHMKERGVPQTSNQLKANTGNYAWSSDNPHVADSYTHQGGIILPLKSTRLPEAVFDAGGSNWEKFFFPHEGDTRKVHKQFKEAMMEPSVKSILVRDIIDPGSNSNQTQFLRRAFAAKYGPDAPVPKTFTMKELEDLESMLQGNNLLIKDPSVMKYKHTGTPTEFADGGQVVASGFSAL